MKLRRRMEAMRKRGEYSGITAGQAKAGPNNNRACLYAYHSEVATYIKGL